MTQTPSQQIDARIAELADWRGEMLSRLRALILETDPAITEDWKWRGVPVWYRDGMVCTGESYRDKLKLTFAKGASLKDPAGMFNASMDGKVRRAIDLYEGDVVDAAAFQALIQEAIAANRKRA
ncbi:DUF1801 domain-containing protein [Stakelama sediminis]|uniref:YdhG-like domain-containing protein n=1 Tax=Stakelama sediminis TaxID=463200 RepID=A0A840YUZ6_9SPHN|nr:DUF1801 domain-containing protein [Stakelama sediminis]MBB5717468.1 hypothetical protein [Stakelama sediminis]